VSVSPFYRNDRHNATKHRAGLWCAVGSHGASSIQYQLQLIVILFLLDLADALILKLLVIWIEFASEVCASMLQRDLRGSARAHERVEHDVAGSAASEDAGLD